MGDVYICKVPQNTYHIELATIAYCGERKSRVVLQRPFYLF